MQDQWYGDKRDLVKWGTLFELVRMYQAKQILLVLYHRPNEWNRLERRFQWERIEIDGQRVEIAPEVIRHFRDVNLIRNLRFPVPIEILSEAFGEERDKYLGSIVTALQKRSDRPSVVFLDPDTGLEPPSGKYLATHVRAQELKCIWDSLISGDVLVLYQHKTAMNNKPFIEPKIRQFCNAIGISRERTKHAFAPLIVQDVAFIFARKD